MSFLSGYQQNSINMSKSISVNRINRSKLNHSSSVASISGIGGIAKKSFYHHTNIFNLKHYKHLTDHIIDGTDIDEIKNHQRSLLIREFRHKVDQYLLFSKYRKEQATREFNTYYSKIQDSLFKTEGYESNKSIIKANGSLIPNGGMSFLSINNEDQNQSLSIIQPELNKSLLNIDANRFNYSKLSKQEASLINNMSIDIYLEDQYGKQRHTTRKFDHKKLQDYIFNKMKPYLSTDTEYDQKIEYFTKEYERILEKIQTQSFRVKVPFNYTPQMQPFNEFYSIDQSKLKDIPKSTLWKDIDEDLMNQVLEDAQLSDEEIEEENIENEESEYEESEVEIEESEEHKSSEKDLQNLEEKKDLEYINYKIQRQQNKQQKQQQEEAFQIMQETQPAQIIVVKKKKKKVKQVAQEPDQDQVADQNQNENQQTMQYKSAQLSQQYIIYIQNKSAPKKRRGNEKDQKGERSAMDEYLIYRPSSPNKPKKKDPPKKQPAAVQRPVAPKKVAQPTTPQSQPQQNKPGRVPPLRTNQQDQSLQRGQTSNESSRQQDTSNLKSKSDTNGEEEVQKQKIQTQNNTNKRSTEKQPSGLANQDTIYQQSQFPTDEDIRSGENTNNVIPLDLTETVRKTKISQTGNKDQIKSNEQQQDNPSQPNTERESTPGKQQSIQDSKVNISQFKKDEEGDEDEYEEEIVIVVPEVVPIQKTDPNQIVQKDPQIDKKDSIQLTPRDREQTKGNNTPKSPQVPPKIPQQAQRQQPASKVESNNPSAMNTPKAVVIGTPSNRTSGGFNYLADNKVKKRVGTGLIEELVKTNYLLDFDSNQFKKERKQPELPKDLEFKQNEDKQLFDSIFKWQYEVDQDIEEMENKLNKKGQNKNRHDDSDDDDDDDRDSQGKKSSIHSSDITDFGEPAPDKNTLQNVSSDGLSDIE